jgi:hypothetical protein
VSSSCKQFVKGCSSRRVGHFDWEFTGRLIDVERLAGISSRSRHEPQRALENVNTTQRFYIKTASTVAVDAMKKLEEKITGTAVVQQAAVN